MNIGKIVTYSFYTLIFIFLIYAGFDSLRRLYHFNNYSVITYSKVDSLFLDHRGHRTFSVTFKADGNLYRAEINYADDITPEIGDEFKVEYSSKDPNLHRIILYE
ncbi:hypothetical protein [Ohtaekwangia koreensis]|uniref:DUF3592 domain-containing protein n=1 Tax=Ohtaekwangia koreensis TaxID=688867 RepID=A0A1T5KMJ7_9BACT|nr:hypothetical protein [Ohtaekwangia koreensis]SKC64883.1 hypothetical protein SAMN05660236_2369 [Ohtaekwangia koreensis]